MREFNVNGVCNDVEHYMVDINGKIDQIMQLVDKRKYFTINRARQYGKTTVIRFLAQRLREHYIVLSTSFEGIGDFVFQSEENFNRNFIAKLSSLLKKQDVSSECII